MYGAVLTDLSKAFDCLPYQLVINKLYAYGFKHDACMLIASYFTGRKQRVRLGGHKSEWLTISKGAPQGSVFGPFVFNLFQNDLVSKLKSNCDVYYYADDNAVGVCDCNYNGLQIKLRQVGKDMLQWFDMNVMQANPSKFQYMVFSKSEEKRPLRLNAGVILQPQECVNVLGTNTDSRLILTNIPGISYLRKKAAMGINALSRMSTCLDYTAKICLLRSFISVILITAQ